MSNIINLNCFRKSRERDEAAQSADENRAKFSRTKAQKKKDMSEACKASQHIESHKLEDDES